MEIKPTVQITNNDIGAKQVADKPADNKSSTTESAVVSAQDGLTLTNTAKEMLEIQSRLHDTSEVDIAKVEELRAAIEDGTYKIDSEQLANNLIQSSLELP